MRCRLDLMARSLVERINFVIHSDPQILVFVLSQRVVRSSQWLRQRDPPAYESGLRETGERAIPPSVLAVTDLSMPHSIAYTHKEYQAVLQHPGLFLKESKISWMQFCQELLTDHSIGQNLTELLRTPRRI
jgi:hypothetical protein